MKKKRRIPLFLTLEITRQKLTSDEVTEGMRDISLLFYKAVRQEDESLEFTTRTILGDDFDPRVMFEINEFFSVTNTDFKVRHLLYLLRTAVEVSKRKIPIGLCISQWVIPEKQFEFVEKLKVFMMKAVTFLGYDPVYLMLNTGIPLDSPFVSMIQDFLPNTRIAQGYEMPSNKNDLEELESFIGHKKIRPHSARMMMPSMFLNKGMMPSLQTFFQKNELQGIYYIPDFQSREDLLDIVSFIHSEEKGAIEFGLDFQEVGTFTEVIDWLYSELNPTPSPTPVAVHLRELFPIVLN
jgi:hypothetical protein